MENLIKWSKKNKVIIYVNPFVMSRNGFLQKKIIIISGVIISILALVTSIYLSASQKTPEVILKDTASFINKVFMYPFTALNKDKNITQSESYLIQKNVNESLEKEIQELKDALELNKTLTEYTPVNATILSRNKSYWFNTLSIDKGSKDSLKKDMAVVTKNGLIGKINKVYTNSSEIKLITADDVNFKVSVSIKNNDQETHAILSGYDQKNNLLKVIWVDKTVNIEKGSTVVTSGLGGLFPAGIYIGTVEKIESDKYNLSKTLYIKTNQNFSNIHYVTVLKEKA